MDAAYSILTRETRPGFIRRAREGRGIGDSSLRVMVSVVDSRFRGNDRILDSTFMGITKREAAVRSMQRKWIPALRQAPGKLFAGMTRGRGGASRPSRLYQRSGDWSAAITLPV